MRLAQAEREGALRLIEQHIAEPQTRTRLQSIEPQQASGFARGIDVFANPGVAFGVVPAESIVVR